MYDSFRNHPFSHLAVKSFPGKPAKSFTELMFSDLLPSVSSLLPLLLLTEPSAMQEATSPISMSGCRVHRRQYCNDWTLQDI